MRILPKFKYLQNLAKLKIKSKKKHSRIFSKVLFIFHSLVRAATHSICVYHKLKGLAGNPTLGCDCWLWYIA